MQTITTRIVSSVPCARELAAAVDQSILTNAVVAFETEGDMASLLVDLHFLDCDDCDDDGDTVWGIDPDGSEFRIRPTFTTDRLSLVAIADRLDDAGVDVDAFWSDVAGGDQVFLGAAELTQHIDRF